VAIAAEQLTDTLCLACGLCCNGVLFKDVELQAGDDPAHLKALGQPVETPRGKARFAQPCAALCPDNRCRIYDERPARCRQFECALFQAVAAGKVELPAALRVIRSAHRSAAKVRELLASLGDCDEGLALSLRFQRTKRRLERDLTDDETAERYADLTLAVHELNLHLGREFYP
jgi:uncharacterized protein